MTGTEIYERAIALLGLSCKDVSYYKEMAVECLNQMLANTLWQQNALMNAAGGEQFSIAPRMTELDEDIPYEENMVCECYPYGLAALLIAEEDHEEYNRMSYEYELHRQLFMPCYETDIEEAY